MLESELFGYEEGAYTGAKKGGKTGKFVLADKGVLFLDEITNMPYDMQAKLLRALQEKKIVPIGGNEPVTFDVQVIAATNKDIVQEVEKGNFRRDLFYRLNIIHIYVPPLRERENDWRILVNYFMKKYNSDGDMRLSREVIDIFSRYKWPGNVRQLENTIERMVIISNKAVIGRESVPNEILSNVAKPGDEEMFVVDNEKSLDDICRVYVEKMVNYCGGNVKKASEILGVSRVTVYKYLKSKENGGEV